MEYKTLGNTGLLVSRLCLGTMTFSGGEDFYKVIGTVDQKGADELVKVAFADGINFFDTADVYSDGESEKTLGHSLKNLNISRKDVVLATKVYGRVGPGRNDVGLRVDTSWTPSKRAFGDSRQTTSISTRSMPATSSLRSKKPCEPSTRWSLKARSASDAGSGCPAQGSERSLQKWRMEAAFLCPTRYRAVE